MLVLRSLRACGAGCCSRGWCGCGRLWRWCWWSGYGTWQSAPLCGKISDWLKTRKWVLLFALIGGVAYTAVVFTCQVPELYWGIMILAGIAGGFQDGIQFGIGQAGDHRRHHRPQFGDRHDCQ